MAFMLMSIELPSPGMLDNIWLSSDSYTLMVVGTEFGAVPEDGSVFLLVVVNLGKSHVPRCK